MKTARDIMTSPVTVVTSDTTLEAAAQMMLDRRFGCLPVVDDAGKLCGIVTESSFAAKSKGIPMSTFRAPNLLGRWLSGSDVETIFAEVRETPVSDIMSVPVVSVVPTETLNRVVEIMLEHDINRVVVTDDGKPIGIVARHDLLRMFSETGRLAD